MRLASVNAASGVDRRTWSPSLDRLAGAIGDLDADVVGLQEVDHLLPRSGTIDQTAVFARALAAGGAPWQQQFAAAVHGTPGDRRTFRAAAPGRPDEPSYGVALLTSYDVESWSEVHMPAGRARLPVPIPTPQRVLWVPDEPRVALAAVLATPGGRLSVICTHLSFSPLHAVRQLRRLVTWADALPRPLILLGDLNLPGAMPAAASGWQRTVSEPTYPARRPRLQLDHVLLDDPARRLHVAHAATAAVAGSDHRALVVDVSVR